MAFASLASGQGVTSSNLTGVVEDENGNGISAVKVTLLHVPTGSIIEKTTNASGRYSFRSLRVGGPYTITVQTVGYEPRVINNVFTELGRAQRTNFTLVESDDQIVELDAFTVKALPNTVFNVETSGVGSFIDAEAMQNTAEFNRHVNDYARLNPLIAINEDGRNELTAAGQNSRFNSIRVDGVRINDQFGLESDGTAAFRNPISIDTIEQVTAEVSPFDVRHSGFTGATINAVTRSGTNTFRGKTYFEWAHDGFRDEDDRGRNDDFTEETFGAWLAGPILQDKLFFFVSYEEFTAEEPPGSPGFEPDPTALQTLNAYLDSLGVDFGQYRTDGVSSTETEEKILAKFDWQINADHRVSFKYNESEGLRPNVGNFDDFGETAFDSNFYTQFKTEEVITFQSYNNWSDTFSTEFSFAKNDFDQPTTFDTALPQVEIDDFPIAGGGFNELFFGTEQFRHANRLSVETENITFAGAWDLGNHSVSFGIDREESEFFNLFLENAFGNFTFATLEDFLNDDIQNSFRFTGVNGSTPAAVSDFAVTGFFIQDSMEVNENLELEFGLRYDTVSSDSTPPLAQRPGFTFTDVFGFPNTGTIDGADLLAPRLSFKYKLGEDKNTQIRGGAGLFLGRSPWVWVSNAFTNNGMTSNRLTASDAGSNLDSFVDYIDNFDPSIQFVDLDQGTPSVDAIAPGLNLPSIWKYNLAFDKTFELANEQQLVLTFEYLHQKTEDAFNVENINLASAGTGPDGRALFDGRVTEDFNNVFLLRNTGAGDSTYLTARIEKPFANNWYASLSYTLGDAEEASPFTSSRASSNWNNVARFNQNTDETSTSNYEIKSRLFATTGYTFEFFGEKNPTRISATYEARSGRPYSAVFRADVNGDGRNNNDLFYVPSGSDDPLVANGDSADFAALMEFIDGSELASFKGGYVPRNALTNPWVQRLDIKVVQELNIWENVKSKFFVSVVNANGLLNQSSPYVAEYGFPFVRRIASASIDENNRFVYDAPNADSIRNRFGTFRSRWAGKMGVSLEF